MTTYIRAGAQFSSDDVYRYALWRHWDDTLPLVAFIGLNPSTADETTDDPTIRRCVGFAKSWGYGGVMMLNLFAVRATDPKDMLRTVAPIGHDNDAMLLRYSRQCALIVAAWGTDGSHRQRDLSVRRLMVAEGRELHMLKLTKDGHPAHPLYLPANLTPQRWGDACTCCKSRRCLCV